MAESAAVRTGPVEAHDANVYYRVFLNHLRKAVQKGLQWPVETVCEIGPGYHLGVGLSAVLAGAERYLGFDLQSHVALEGEGAMLDALAGRFREGARPMRDSGGPAFTFPDAIIPEALRRRAQAPERLAQIRADLESGGDGRIVRYVAPWEDRWREHQGGADFLLSQSCLEHVEEIARAYGVFFEVLRPGGFMSHKIDFRVHGYSVVSRGLWNGHWLHDERRWAEIVAGDSFSLNRLTCSQHLELIAGAGFEIVRVEKRMDDSVLAQSDLAPQFHGMSDEDLHCSGVLVQARRP